MIKIKTIDLVLFLFQVFYRSIINRQDGRTKEREGVPVVMIDKNGKMHSDPMNCNQKNNIYTNISHHEQLIREFINFYNNNKKKETLKECGITSKVIEPLQKYIENIDNREIDNFFNKEIINEPENIPNLPVSLKISKPVANEQNNPSEVSQRTENKNYNKNAVKGNIVKRARIMKNGNVNQKNSIAQDAMIRSNNANQMQNIANYTMKPKFLTRIKNNNQEAIPQNKIFNQFYGNRESAMSPSKNIQQNNQTSKRLTSDNLRKLPNASKYFKLIRTFNCRCQ